MRSLRTVILLAGIALVLSACNALVPDQHLTNPLGLNGQSVTLNAISTTGLGTQQASHTATFQGSTSTTIQDPNLSGVPGWVHPSGFKSDVSATTATLKPGSAGTLPATLDVTEVKFALTLADGSGAPTLNWTYTTGQHPQILVLTQQSCGTVAQGCTYDVAAGPDLNGALVPVSLSSSDVSTLWSIINGGSSTDNVSVTTTVTVDSGTQAVPSGSQLVVKLGNETGTLTF